MLVGMRKTFFVSCCFIFFSDLSPVFPQAYDVYFIRKNSPFIQLLCIIHFNNFGHCGIGINMRVVLTLDE